MHLQVPWVGYDDLSFPKGCIVVDWVALLRLFGRILGAYDASETLHGLGHLALPSVHLEGLKDAVLLVSWGTNALAAVSARI